MPRLRVEAHPIILALEQLRQEDRGEFEASLRLHGKFKASQNHKAAPGGRVLRSECRLNGSPEALGVDISYSLRDTEEVKT